MDDRSRTHACGRPHTQWVVPLISGHRRPAAAGDSRPSDHLRTGARHHTRSGWPSPGPPGTTNKVTGSPGSGRSGTGPAYVMRVQRDRIHPGSRHASSVRQNPPRRDSREPTSHNSSSGDMTNSTPPGAPSGGARTPGAAGAGGGGPDGVGGGLAPSPGVPGRLVPSENRSPGPAPGGTVGRHRRAGAARESRGNRGITAERPVGGGTGAPRMAIAAPPSFQGTRPRFRNRSSCAAVV